MLLRKIFAAVLMAIPVCTMAQSSYTIPGGKEEWLLNRMDIKFNPAYLRFSSLKPYNRKYAVKDIDSLNTLVSAGKLVKTRLNKIDSYNAFSFQMANSEWSKPNAAFNSKKPILKHFNKNQANGVEIKKDGYTVIMNAIVQYQQFKEKNNSENIFLNVRGLQARGVIEDKIGFSFYFTENQERPPSYVSNWVNQYKAVPGVGYYKRFKTSTGFDYFDIRSAVSWKVNRFMDMQLAYDRNFIGNGYRSLFLSDFSNNYMFLKVNSHFKRFQYQNIFAELTGKFRKDIDNIYSRKYYRAHYLTYNAAPWLNVSLFDATILGTDKFNLALFSPVMFLNIPSTSGVVKDRHYTGIDFKANVFHTVQLYGQWMIDRLNTKGLSSKTWDNRFGYQLGIKYIDAFGIDNLDLQLESNRVRPYTYAASDSLTLYSHYNQPLAHPLGANFLEVIFIARYQPVRNVYIQAKAIGYRQGKDLATYNMGSNVFGGFNNRLSDTKVQIGDGDPANCVLASMLVSYEVRQNLFIDANFTYRKYDTALTGNYNLTFGSIGVRFNMARREHDF